MQDKHILVTGGAGYIGSHACKVLKQAGYTPVVYDNLSNGSEEAVKWGELEVGDIHDSKRLCAVIKKYQPLAVMHFAAYIFAGESVTHPGKYYENNTYGGIKLLESMRVCGIKKLVFSSTAAVYGSPDSLPITEETTIQPINPYGKSKWMLEEAIKDYGVSDNIECVTLRYFNAAGADADLETGCRHKQPQNLLPILMNVQSGRQENLQLFGTDYATADGTAIRDYIHVSDLADAHILALGYLLDGGKSTTLNLGTGKGHSVKEVIDSAARVTGKEVAYVACPRRAGDPPELVADAGKAKNILNWQASYTQLDAIVKTAWDWQKHYYT